MSFLLWRKGVHRGGEFDDMTSLLATATYSNLHGMKLIEEGMIQVSPRFKSNGTNCRPLGLPDSRPLT